MFGRHDTDVVDDGTAHRWGWPRSERARRRERERADAEMIGEIRWQWRSACTGSSLAQIVYTPSGPTRAIPMIGDVDLGPPVVLTVRMRPGQRIDDLIAAAPSIAPALNATALQVTPLVQNWVRIVVVAAPLVTMPERRTG